jgi:hypothetical protein
MKAGRRFNSSSPPGSAAARLGVRDYVHSAIRVNASEAGEFVTQIRIDAGIPHSEGWRRWSSYYRTDPPGIFDRIIA